MTNDLYVGFRETPKGIERFLEEEGYVESKDSPDSEGVRIYTPKNNDWPQLFYIPSIRDDERRDSVWEGYPVKISSEININYSYRDQQASDEAERISQSLVDKFDAICYDPILEEFLIKGAL